MLEHGVRIGVLVVGGAGVDEQLQRQLQPLVARVQRADGRQRAAGRIAADGDARGVQAQRCPARAGQPVQRVPGVVHGGGKAPLRRQPVVERQHGGAALLAEHAAKGVVRFDAANGEAAAVRVQQHRQAGVVAGRDQARAQLKAVARGDVQVFHARQIGLGDVEHADGFGVRGLGVGRAQRVHGRVRRLRHALDQEAHGGGQAGVDVGGMVHERKRPLALVWKARAAIVFVDDAPCGA